MEYTPFSRRGVFLEVMFFADNRILLGEPFNVFSFGDIFPCAPCSFLSHVLYFEKWIVPQVNLNLTIRLSSALEMAAQGHALSNFLSIIWLKCLLSVRRVVEGV